MKQDKAVFWWASPSFHWRFRSFYLALLVPMSRNFRRLESRARIFRSISGSEMIKTLYSLGLKFWNRVWQSRIRHSITLVSDVLTVIQLKRQSVQVQQQHEEPYLSMWQFFSFEIWLRVLSIYKTFRGFVPPENFRKKRKIPKGRPVFPVGTFRTGFVVPFTRFLYLNQSNQSQLLPTRQPSWCPVG